MKTNKNKMRRHPVKWRPVHTVLKWVQHYIKGLEKPNWLPATLCNITQLCLSHPAGCLQAWLCLCTSTLWAMGAAIQEPTQGALWPCLLGEGDSTNSSGRQPAKICREELNVQQKKEQREFLPHGEQVGHRQAAYPPASDSRWGHTGWHGLSGSS